MKIRNAAVFTIRAKVLSKKSTNQRQSKMRLRPICKHSFQEKRSQTRLCSTSLGRNRIKLHRVSPSSLGSQCRKRCITCITWWTPVLALPSTEVHRLAQTAKERRLGVRLPTMERSPLRVPLSPRRVASTTTRLTAATSLPLRRVYTRTVAQRMRPSRSKSNS